MAADIESFKILLIGDAGAGKSQLLKYHAPNSAIDFKTMEINLGEQKVNLKIWVAPGKENFFNITHVYYRGVQGILLVFDVADQKSFDNIPNWHRNIKQQVEGNVPVILIGNDGQIKERVIEGKIAEELAQKLEIPYIETHALDPETLKTAFITLAEKIQDLKHPQAGNLNENTPQIKNPDRGVFTDFFNRVQNLVEHIDCSKPIRSSSPKQ